MKELMNCWSTVLVVEFTICFPIFSGVLLMNAHSLERISQKDLTDGLLVNRHRNGGVHATQKPMFDLKNV